MFAAAVGDIKDIARCQNGEVLASVPHLGYKCRENDRPINVLFSPAIPAAGAAFLPAA